ncbi:hypothetical protein JTB14_031749 [Gonioctena quinquepunctata]|nr:hypothetical protein JTB14_031749 [Gonioctena quinquepunctata]
MNSIATNMDRMENNMERMEENMKEGTKENMGRMEEGINLKKTGKMKENMGRVLEENRNEIVNTCEAFEEEIERQNAELYQNIKGEINEMNNKIQEIIKYAKG